MTPLESIEQILMSRVRGPVLAQVQKSYITPGKPGGYCLDAEVLRPSAMTPTGEILKEVPISPLWAGADGRGVFAPPEAGQTAVIGFVELNPAWPFYQGIWADSYSPAGGAAGELVITDGTGAVIKLNGKGLISLTNSTIGLKTILEEIYTQMSTLKLTAPSGAVTYVDIAGITAARAKIAALLEA